MPHATGLCQPIDQCRICGNQHLVSVLSLGEQHLTGVFPRSAATRVTCGPLELVKCHSETAEHCGLLQLRHSYDLQEMYGENYGYRSGLNKAMVEHLRQKVAGLMAQVPLRKRDLVLDIGSNDGTTLGFYPEHGPTLVGIDPTGAKFKQYYRPDIQQIPDFFSGEIFRRHFGQRKARIVTSIAMFYDLAHPIGFMEQVHDVLADDGVWHFEQSYMPQMLKVNAYDTVCHEHLEYYGLKQIKWMTDRCDLKILDVQLNDTNGGSFAVTVAKTNAPYTPNTAAIEKLLAYENELALHTLAPYERFRQRVFHHRDELLKLLGKLHAEKAVVLGYGASTKGNVILQFCGLSAHEIPAIAEVNPDKFGCVTPGTHIPIVSEADAHAMKPDYLLALPWHFKHNLLAREGAFLARGGKMIFPLPEIEVVGT